MIEEFKRLFPHSKDIEQVEKKLFDIIEKSDWKQENLKGSVKSIFYQGILEDDVRINLVKEFNEGGRLMQVRIKSGGFDEVEILERSFKFPEFIYETRTLQNFGVFSEFVGTQWNLISSYGGSVILSSIMKEISFLMSKKFSGRITTM